MRSLLYALALIVSAVVPGFAQDLSVGDSVLLVERDIHIPAHPAPGDNRIPFRFAGGSTAQILAIDEATGWFQIHGERVGGVQDLPRLDGSDLRGWTITLSLSLGGLK